jgi:hypothetical protein|tara:strand:- start:202 stop:546 length:345 start_codon:yes stop_codon:yes gene_type:complete
VVDDEEIEPGISVFELVEIIREDKEIIDLSSLAGVRQLTYLDLSRRPKLANVNSLAGLTQLEALYLQFNPNLNDVSALTGLANLKLLNLKATPNLAKSQVDELQKSLPECKIYR